MKIKYYYFRDKNNTPRVTRCIVKDEFGNVGVGTSLCSLQDNPNKTTGKRIAYGRALKALAKNKSYSPILRNKASGVLYTVISNFKEFVSLQWKGLFVPKHQYGAYLSTYEKALLSGPSHPELA